MAEKNTIPMGAADLTQDPADFMNIALGKVEVQPPKADEAKPKESADGTTPLPKEEAPRDNADKPADDKKPEEEKAPEAKPEPKTPNVEHKLTPEEFQKREAAKIIQRQGEERKRAMLAHIEATKANSDHIHTIAKFDRKLANEVIKEVWGYQDYDELIAQAKIAEIKETDPEKAELEGRLLRLEMEAKKQTLSAKGQLEKVFFVSKGFTPNEYDPRYVKVMEKLSLLNPTFVASDYSGALAEAYRMATGEEIVDTSKDVVQEALNRAAPTAAPQSIKQPHAPQSAYSDEANSFAGLLGVKI
jgi:DNA-directed RNA polymerase subunit F